MDNAKREGLPDVGPSSKLLKLVCFVPCIWIVHIYNYYITLLIFFYSCFIVHESGLGQELQPGWDRGG